MEVVGGLLSRIRKIKPIPTPQENRNSPSPQGINSQLMKALQRNEVDIQKVAGMPAVFETSDPFTTTYLEQVASAKPNGYLVGVGVGGIFGFLEVFSPQGIIAADVNPYVVAAGRIMVEALHESEDFDTFYGNLFNLSKDQYKAKLTAVARKDPRLAKAMRDFRHKYDHWDPLVGFTPMSSRERVKDNTPDDVDVLDFIRENFLKLRGLALKDNIAICFADILDEDFVKAVRDLSDFSDKTNLIYFSNAIWFAKESKRKTEGFGVGSFDNVSRTPIYSYSVHLRDGGMEMKTGNSFEEVLKGQT